MPGGQLAAGERAAGPGEPDRVLGQPRVPGADLGQPGLERLLRGVDRLAQRGRRSGPRRPAGRAPSSPSRRPAPARSRARRGSGRPPKRGSASCCRSASNSCSPACTTANSSTALTPRSRMRGVGGVPGDLQPEGQRAGVRGDDRLRGRLGDDADVAEVPAPQRRPGAEAAVLLADDAVQRDRAHQPHARRPDGGQRGQRGDDAGLHVAGAAAVDRAVRRGAGRTGRRPRGTRSPGRDDVGVAGEDQGGDAVLGGGQRADDAPRLGPLDLLAGGVGLGRGLGEVDLPGVDVAAEFVEPAGEQVLDLALGGGAADRRDGDQAAEPVDHPVLVDGVQDPGLGVGEVAPWPESGTRRGDALGRPGALA